MGARFYGNCASRVRGRLQLTTDGHKAYLDAVEGAFGCDIDYAVLQKTYGATSVEEQRRYSPAKCIGCDMKTVMGNPDPAHAVHYNFARIHKTLRITPAMAARLADSAWTLGDMILMADSYMSKPGKRGPYKKKISRWRNLIQHLGI